MKNSKQSLVIKLGTSTLTEKTSTLSRTFIREMARQISVLHKKGVQIAIVSSGSIAAGREVLSDRKRHRSLPEKQMLAAVGQVQLMRIWTEIFAEFGIAVGQLLLTRGDFTNRKRYLNARNTIESLLEHNVIPVINENDTVTTQEIQVGDNDNLSALVANLIGADLLILLTDQPGLYTADPNLYPDAKIIPFIEQIDDSTFELAGKVSGSSGLGTGGMWTKLEAAQIATQSGTPTVIASAEAEDVILNLAEGKHIGSLFRPKTTPKESRKRWFLSEQPQGKIYINEGAESSICQKGASLLPIGIVKVESSFDRGALVRIISPCGTPCAVGISNYSYEEIHKIMNMHSTEIESTLGYSYGPEVIHRDNMAILSAKKEF